MFITRVRFQIMDEPAPGPSGVSTLKTGKKRKFAAPKSEQELLDSLVNSDDDVDDPTFWLADELKELKKGGWTDSDDEEEEDDENECVEEVDSIFPVNESVQSSSDNVLHVPQPQTMRQQHSPGPQRNHTPIIIWTHTPPAAVQQPNFEKARQLLILPKGDAPIDFFDLLVNETFFELIARETNQYAIEVFLNAGAADHSRISRWKEVTGEEIRTFFGLVMHMGTIQLSRLQDYWKKDPLFDMPIFAANMSRDRFLLILRCMHFAKNPAYGDPVPEDRLYKIRPIIDYFNNRMVEIYYPDRCLSLDESMMLWRGRLVFRQYIKNKKHKYGIKLYALTEPDGTVIKFSVYTGTLDEYGGRGHASKVVMHLMEEKLDAGHALFMDNYYNSYDLAVQLLQRNTLCTGTLRSNRQNTPLDIKNAKLGKGETLARYANGVMIGKWRDKREVTYISTEFGNSMVEFENRRHEVQQKPHPILEYNKYMGGVDKKDQMMAYYPFERKTLRWNLKLGLHIFHMLLINSYHIFKKYGPNSRMPLYDFRLHIIRQLLPVTRTARELAPVRRTEHVLGKNAATGSRKVSHRRCVICYKNKVRKETAYCCVTCPTKPALCATGVCFSVHHENP